MRKYQYFLATGAALLALLASGCSPKTADSGGDAAGDIKTGPGVTASTITLGALTDLTGPVAVLGKPILQGNQLYVDELNAAGGICGRTIKLDVKDHRYDVQQAVSAYSQIESQVLGLLQLHGSAITSALEDQIHGDNLLTVPVSLASTLLSNPQLIIPGATYDLQAISMIDHLATEKGVERGDTVGLIYLGGAAGENALTGAQYAAEKLGLTLQAMEIEATVVDVNAQITTLKAQGAKAILVVTGPRPVASAASVAKATGYDVPILTTDPGFHPALMDTPAAPVLEANVLVFSSIGPLSTDSPAADRLRTAHAAEFPEEPLSAWVTWGYVTAQIYGEILQKACDNKDLTRDGLAKSFSELNVVDSEGLFPPLDFSQQGEPSSTQVYIGQPDRNAAGGLTVVKPFFGSDLATGYQK